MPVRHRRGNNRSRQFLVAALVACRHGEVRPDRAGGVPPREGAAGSCGWHAPPMTTEPPVPEAGRYLDDAESTDGSGSLDAAEADPGTEDPDGRVSAPGAG